MPRISEIRFLNVSIESIILRECPGRNLNFLWLPEDKRKREKTYRMLVGWDKDYRDDRYGNAWSETRSGSTGHSRAADSSRDCKRIFFRSCSMRPIDEIVFGEGLRDWGKSQLWKDLFAINYKYCQYLGIIKRKGLLIISRLIEGEEGAERRPNSKIQIFFGSKKSAIE